jgi:hypothetical protein
VLAAGPGRNDVAPPELWDRIARELDSAHDDLAARRARAARRRVAATTLAAAAAVVLALVVVGVAVGGDGPDGGGSGSDEIAAAYDHAVGEAGAKQASLVAADGGETVARAVVLPDGTGYLVNDTLAPLGAEETYQLWAAVGNTDEPRVISAGVLGSDPEAAGFTVSGDVHTLMLTVEVAGGVPATANDPVAAGDLTAPA